MSIMNVIVNVILQLYKTCQRTKEKSIKILLPMPMKDILKTLPSSAINNYIKILQRQHSRKTAVKGLGKME